MKTTVTNVYFGRQTINGAWWVDGTRAVHRLYFVNSGTAVVKYAGKTRTLCAGNIYLLPRSDDFETVDAKDFDHTFFDYYSIPALRFDSFTQIDGGKSGYRDFFSFLNTAFAEKKLDKRTAKDFLCGILSVIDKNENLPYITNTLIIMALDIIHADAINETTESVAQRLNLNKSYFIQLFSRTVGTTPMKYIRSLRVQEGIKLLKDGMSVEETAEKCGFSATSGFFKAVRREYGCTPKWFKKE